MKKLSRYNTSAALCSVCYAPISVAGNMIVSLWTQYIIIPNSRGTPAKRVFSRWDNSGYTKTNIFITNVTYIWFIWLRLKTCFTNYIVFSRCYTYWDCTNWRLKRNKTQHDCTYKYYTKRHMCFVVIPSIVHRIMASKLTLNCQTQSMNRLENKPDTPTHCFVYFVLASVCSEIRCTIGSTKT